MAFAEKWAIHHTGEHTALSPLAQEEAFWETSVQLSLRICYVLYRNLFVKVINIFSFLKGSKGSQSYGQVSFFSELY